MILLNQWFKFLIVCASFHFGLGTRNVTEQANFVEELLKRPGYNPRVRPGGVLSESPTIVSLDFFINSISSIDEVNMEYTMSIFMRQSWVDPRLEFSGYNDTITLSFDHINRIWVPDLYFKNEKKGTFHDITVPNRLLTLSPLGLVYYSQRLSLILSCELNLMSYPMDNQTCSVEVESFGYTTKELIFKWKDIQEPVQVTDNLQLPEFILDRKHIELGDCTSGYVTGAFSCKFARLKFFRQFNYYLVQVYIPTTLIVALSWVSFWIDIHAVPARISLGLLTVLTMTTQSSGISSRLPRVSYIKAIDIWTTACLAFVFGGLVEYSIVNVLARKQKNTQEAAKKTKEAIKFANEIARIHSKGLHQEEVDLTFQTEPGNESLRKRMCSKESDSRQQSISESEINEEDNRSWIQKLRTNRALLVDVISRFGFPLVFIIFNLVYWIIYYQPRDVTV